MNIKFSIKCDFLDIELYSMVNAPNWNQSITDSLSAEIRHPDNYILLCQSWNRSRILACHEWKNGCERNAKRNVRKTQNEWILNSEDDGKINIALIARRNYFYSYTFTAGHRTNSLEKRNHFSMNVPYFSWLCLWDILAYFFFFLF